MRWRGGDDRAAVLVLGVVLAARLIAMACLPLFDPTEGRYAQIAQEMAVTGDWVTPRIWMNGEQIPFLGKPPLYFWAAALSMRLLGINEFAARMPNLIAAVVLLTLLGTVTERYGGKGSGLLSVQIAASSALLFGLGGAAVSDVFLALGVGGSLLCYYAFNAEESVPVRRWWSLGVFLLLAVGVLAKGPVALLLFGIPTLIWTIRWCAWRELRHHPWFIGIPLFVALTVPWFVLCEVHNPGFIRYFLINEHLLRYLTPDYGDAYGSGHIYPRGSALPMALIACAPWSLVALWHLRRSGRRLVAAVWRDRASSYLFLGVAAGPLFWCLARQLLITYMLPIVPLFAGWLATDVARDSATRDRWLRAGRMVLVAMGALIAVSPLFLQGTKSSRDVVRAAALAATAGKERPTLVFARRTPYSALFYARGWVVPHPKEKLAATLTRFRGSQSGVLAIITESHRADLADLRDWEITPVAARGRWLLLLCEPEAAASSGHGTLPTRNGEASVLPSASGLL